MMGLTSSVVPFMSRVMVRIWERDIGAEGLIHVRVRPELQRNVVYPAREGCAIKSVMPSGENEPRGSPGQWHVRNDYRADERLVSRVLLSPGPHGFPLRSGLFLAFARSLSESGILVVLS